VSLDRFGRSGCLGIHGPSALQPDGRGRMPPPLPCLGGSCPDASNSHGGDSQVHDPEHLEPTTARPPSDREHRRNMVALKLAALDLMTVDQIRSYAETNGIALPSTSDHKVLIEVIRRELLR
jgi:hypothetical protein